MGSFLELLLYLFGILIVFVWVMAGHPPHWAWHLIEITKGVLWQ